MKVSKRQLRRIIREEVLRPRLNEATEMLTSKNGSKVVFADWTKKHIEGGHKEPGKGSIFADFDLSKIADAVSKIDVSGDGGVYQLPIPGVGYDLVRPMDQAKKLKGANIIDVEKEEVHLEPQIVEDPVEEVEVEEVSITLVEELNLSTRTRNILLQAGVTEINDLIALSKVELMAIQSFGEKSYLEVREQLQNIKLLPSDWE